MRYRIFVILTATHLCAQRKLGSHFRPRPDVSSLKVGPEKILTAGHASRCGIGFLLSSRQHIFVRSANWVRIFDQDPRREQAPALQRLCEHSAKTLLIMCRKQRSVCSAHDWWQRPCCSHKLGTLTKSPASLTRSQATSPAGFRANNNLARNEKKLHIIKLSHKYYKILRYLYYFSSFFAKCLEIYREV